MILSDFHFANAQSADPKWFQFYFDSSSSFQNYLHRASQ